MRRMTQTPWDPKHLEVVRRGADAIRTWRQVNSVALSLCGADLREVDLQGADFTGAALAECEYFNVDLTGANLSNANLGGTDLTHAVLVGAILDGANLVNSRVCDADLSCASLVGADLRYAELRHSIITRADLTRANLSGALMLSLVVEGADLRGATFGDTVIYSDLTLARNLPEARHHGRSLLDFSLVLRPMRKAWPVSFLRGCGLSDYEIDHGLAIAQGQGPIQFYSCFISYSSKDDRFAVKLHDALQARGIRCWFDKHEVLPGDNITAKVNEGIRLWDKVLLCCSEQSLTSWWVKDEVTRALEKERKLEKERGHEVLAIIPLDLDGYLLDETRCMQENAPTLRKRHAPPFRGWEADEKLFDAQLERVAKALRTDRPTPPPSKL
jgi:uncharacterized protein YjbI with pentapeptide repeats